MVRRRSTVRFRNGARVQRIILILNSNLDSKIQRLTTATRLELAAGTSVAYLETDALWPAVIRLKYVTDSRVCSIRPLPVSVV
jgi:hypothetical protein